MARNPNRDERVTSPTVAHPGFQQLLRHYLGNQLVLYTGAGVSHNDDGLGIGGDWDGFLRSLVEEYAAEAAPEFEPYSIAHNPWEQADWLAARVGEQTLTQAIYQKVRAKGVFQRHFMGLLDREFARGAATLRAVAAFSVEMVGFSQGRRAGRAQTYPRVMPNRRIPAILSTNYDPYLEAAASSMFRTPIGTHPLKPVGDVSSTAGVLGQTPVFHVHGYVPPDPRKDDSRDRIVNPVLTSRDYAEAWANRADSYTIGPQTHLLRHYSALFLGFSFRDDWVSGLLRQIRAERSKSKTVRTPHFALVRDREIGTRSPRFFSDLGVVAIPWHEPADIPAALSYLYEAGLAHDMVGRGPLVLTEFEPGRRRAVRTGRAAIADGPDVPRYLWRNLESAWHNPLAEALPWRIAPIAGGARGLIS